MRIESSIDVNQIAAPGTAVKFSGVEGFTVKESLCTIGLMNVFRLKRISNAVGFCWGVDVSW